MSVPPGTAATGPWFNRPMLIERRPGPGGTLAIRRFEGSRPTIVALHGFGLHGAQFAPLAAVTGWAIDAPDLPGHGLTTIEPVDLDTTITALAAWIEDTGHRRVLGYSQGGRLALHLAWRRPDLVEALVVVSAGAGLEGEPLEMRREIDEAGASRIERDGVGAYLDGWLDDPVFGTTRLDEPSRTADRALRMENAASGLAAALGGLGQGALPKVPVEALACPILWIAGALDAGYVAIMATLAASRGDDLVIVPAVGHNVIAEAPAAIACAVAAWSPPHASGCLGPKR